MMMDQEMDDGRRSTDAERRRGSLHALLIALAGILTYVNSLPNRFALDDVRIILENGRIHQLADQAVIWLTPYWPEFGEHLGLYRPLAIFAYAVQWAIGDGAPWVFHTTNVVLHVAVCLLVYRLLLGLAGRTPALVGALLFAVHPVHTEVVANVVGQAELISAAMVIAACIAYVERPDAMPSRRRTAVIAAFFVIGLLAKEGAVVLPALLIALDIATRRVTPGRDSIVRYVRSAAGPMLVLAAALTAYLTLRIVVLGSIGGVDAAPNLPFLRQGHRFLSALRAWPEYARLLVYPMDLSADYSPGVVLPVASMSPMVWLGAVIMVGTLALAIATPWLSAVGLAAAWFFIAIFPVSNLVMPIGVLLAERILYLPSVAASIAIAMLWRNAQHRIDPRRVRLVIAFVSVVIVGFGVRSALRNPSWHDSDTVWDTLTREHPESYRSQWTNGYRMVARGNNELATAFFELSYRIWADDAILINNLAGMYLQAGRYADALPLLERSDSLVPGILDRTEQFLSFAYLGLNRFQESLDASIRADRLNATRAVTMAVRAQAYEGLGRYPEAAGAWRYATRHKRGRTTPTFWMMLARDLARVGYPDQALAAADTAALFIEKGSAIDSTLGRLRHAIDSGCYAIDPSSDSIRTAPSVPCEDPLDSWGIILPPAAKEVANALQNATD